MQISLCLIQENLTAKLGRQGLFANRKDNKMSSCKIDYDELLDVLKRSMFAMIFTTESCFIIKTEGDREAFEQARKDALIACSNMLYTMDVSLIEEA